MATSGKINLSVTSLGNAISGWIEWTESNIDPSANTSKVTAKLVYRNSSGYSTYSDESTFYLTVNGSKATKTNGYNLAAGGTYTVLTNTVTVAHNADGSKSITISGGGALTGTQGLSASSGSGTAALTAIPRASVPTVSQSAIDMGQTVRVKTNAKNGNFYHRIWYTFGGSEGYGGDFDSTTLYNWSDLTPRLELARRIPNAASGTCTVYLRTFTDRNMTTRVGEDQTVSFTLRVPDSVKPAAALTVEIVNDNTTLAQWGVAVKGYSKLRYAITGDVTGDYGATLSAYQFKANGETLTAQTGTTKALSTAGNMTAKGWVKDSRGRWSAVREQTINVYDYSLPEIVQSDAYRVDASGDRANDGERVKVICNGRCTSIGDNAVTIKWRWREAGGSWSGYGAISNNTETIISSVEFEKFRSYEVELSVWDSLGNHRELVYSVPTDQVTLDLKKDSVGMGKYAEHPKSLELADDWDIWYKGKALADYIYPVGSIYISAAATDPGTLFGGTWEPIRDRFLLAAGSAYAAGSTGGEAAHTLTVEELAAHSHRILQANNSGTAGVWVTNASTTNARKVSYSGSRTASDVIELTGGGQAHNNMPPYLAVYVWRRTA